MTFFNSKKHIPLSIFSLFISLSWGTQGYLRYFHRRVLHHTVAGALLDDLAVPSSRIFAASTPHFSPHGGGHVALAALLRCPLRNFHLIFHSRRDFHGFPHAVAHADPIPLLICRTIILHGLITTLNSELTGPELNRTSNSGLLIPMSA
uniref:Putative secreted protein n=1 Tax=Lutzomyia longipalpis TaxID=7200 RepID=A0A7G3APU0_LUTLO